jgi:hypothetical protein
MQHSRDSEYKVVNIASEGLQNLAYNFLNIMHWENAQVSKCGPWTSCYNYLVTIIFLALQSILSNGKTSGPTSPQRREPTQMSPVSVKPEEKAQSSKKPNHPLVKPESSNGQPQFNQISVKENRGVFIVRTILMS